MQERQIKSAARRQELTGRAAIVTGSTSGIGLGIAQAFAASGMHVMLNGFGDEKEIRKIRADMEEAHGIKTGYSAADMSKPDDVVRMVEDTRSLLGKVDVLVNNAGIQHVEAIETFPAAKWDAIIAVDLSSAFHTTRAVVAEMKSRKWGRIINVASAHGLVASPYKAAYVAAKHGLLGLTKTAWHHSQRHLPWLRADPFSPEADPRDGPCTGHYRGAGRQGGAPASAADAPVRDHGADRRTIGLPE
jgi:3-hydroxybutyrate dehydrogenase